ncbi:MAG: hypothetical protein KBC98_02885 [Candidatus Pacebacteria bacterium]|nr:hypothetical protein [Candidatus Paceibacterota bacterium]
MSEKSHQKMISQQATNLHAAWLKSGKNEDLHRLLALKRKNSELSWNKLGLGQHRQSIIDAEANLPTIKEMQAVPKKEPMRRPSHAHTLATH